MVGAITAGLVCADIVLPSVGRTINRHGGRPVLVAACFVLAAGLLLVAIAPNLPIIMSVGARSASAWVASLYDAVLTTLGRLYGADRARPS